MGLYYNSGRYVGRKILLYEDKRKMNTLITEHSSSTDSSLESPYGSDVGDVVIGQKRVGATNVVRRTRAKTNLPVILKATKSLGSVLTENGQKITKKCGLTQKIGMYVQSAADAYHQTHLKKHVSVVLKIKDLIGAPNVANLGNHQHILLNISGLIPRKNHLSALRQVVLGNTLR